MFVFKGEQFFAYFGGHCGKIWFFDSAAKDNCAKLVVTSRIGVAVHQGRL
jgi:hypothetical protein